VTIIVASHEMHLITSNMPLAEAWV